MREAPLGKRGPGSARLRAAAKAAPAVSLHPWDKAGMPPAERVLAFLRSLPVVSGIKAGENMELLEFQEQFVRGIYENVDDLGRRRVRLAALSVARGNGKSALLAGLSLSHLLGPMAENYGECYAAALDREQAAVIFRMCRAYIETVGWMANRVNVKDWHKEIVDEQNNSIWRALTSDARKAHGLAPSFWIADEVAQWRSRELWDNLATGMGKRSQALGVTISTQAADDHHFFSEMLDAPPDPTIYVQLHAAAKDCRLDDRTAWQAANPALNHFLNPDQFADAAARAMRTKSFEPSFRLLNLNQRVQSAGKFIEQQDWSANGDEFDPIELEGQVCYGGLDLSSTKDLTAFSLWFPEPGKLLTWHFVPADTIDERSERDRVPFCVWAEAGWITTTPGRATDRLSIVKVLAEVRQSYDVRGIAFDRWRYEDLAKMLNDEGLELPMVEFVPGFRTYAAAVDAFEAAVLKRKMQHNNNPVLRWQASNVVAETDAAGNRKPSKSKSLDRIDGIVTAIMAAGLAARDEGPAIYRGQGPMWL